MNRSIYLLFRDTRVIGVYESEELALKAMHEQPESEDTEYTVEDWPLNEIATRWNIGVCGSK